jgi:hypothetical protein
VWEEKRGLSMWSRESWQSFDQSRALHRSATKTMAFSTPDNSALVRAGLSKFEKDARSERGCRESVEFILSESEYGVHLMAWRKTL